MNFVKSFNLLDIEAKQTSCIELHGAPTTSTEGAVGLLGMDVDSESHNLYKCVSVEDGIYVWEPVISTGDFATESYVDAKITAELEKLEFNVDVISQSNLLNFYPLNITGYIGTKGSLYPNSSNFRSSDYIPIRNDFVIVGNMQPIEAEDHYNVNCYDKDKNFIGGCYRSNDNTTKTRNVTVLNGTYYVRITVYVTDVEALCVFNPCVSDSIDEIIDATQAEKVLGIYNKNIFTEYPINNPGYIKTDGSIASSSTSFQTTDYIPATPKMEIRGTMTAMSNPYNNVNCYDKDKNYLGGCYVSTGEKIHAFNTIEGTYYIRVTTQATDVSNLTGYYIDFLQYVMNSLDRDSSISMLNPKEIMADLIQGQTTKKIKLLGDSITHGMGGTGYTNDAEHGEFIMSQGNNSWYVNTDGVCWANMVKAYFEEKFNCTVKNYGCSGINSAIVKANITTLIEADDDIVVLMIGTNDRHNNTKEQFISNLKHIVNYCVTNQKQIILASSIPCSVTKETDNANRMYHMEDVDYMIMSVATQKGIEYVSMYKDFLDYCQNTDTDIDSLLADGLHPNDDGYAIMFKLFCNGVGIGTKRPGATW
jgi:lysophospholipase L1-like esterase